MKNLMIENLKTIYEGKSTLIKNKQYLSTKSYVEPFVNRLTPLKAEFRILAKEADQVSITNSNEDKIFNRIHIQAILPKDYYYKNNCRKVVGMVYGLDIRVPVVKFYIADIDDDYNLYVSSQEQINIQKLEDSTAIDYTPIKNLLELTDTNAVMVEQLYKTEFANREDMVKKLGEWVNSTFSTCYVNDYGVIKLPSSLPIEVYKELLINKDSKFYIDPSKQIMMIDVYKAFSNAISTDKDIINTFEKTYLANKFLGL